MSEWAAIVTMLLLTLGLWNVHLHSKIHFVEKELGLHDKYLRRLLQFMDEYNGGFR